MTLALMPGSEPIAVQVPEPEAAQPVGNQWQSGDRLRGVGGAAPGCGCASCNQLRSSHLEQEQRLAVAAAQYGGQRADVWVVDETSDYPQGMPSGMIRGRYDMSQSAEPTSWFHGQVRWRHPGTREVYDSEGRRQWTYEYEMPDGALVDRQNRRWVPDNARQAAGAPVFNWESVPPPEFITDNLGNIRRSPS